MFNSSLLCKHKFLCALCSVLLTLYFVACNSNPNLETQNQENQTGSGSNVNPEGSIISQLKIGDTFVLATLNSLIPDFEYNLYSDSGCTDKVLYESASYFIYCGTDCYYFSNNAEYDSENKILTVEVVKNPQKNKTGDSFIFTKANQSYLTTLKITNVSSLMTSGSIDVYENSFNSTDYQAAWNEKTEDFTKVATLYYKVKQDFTTIKALPEFAEELYYLMDSQNEYVKTYNKKLYTVSFDRTDIIRPNHEQNLYQITSDEEYWYFGFSDTARDAYNKALLDNCLGMPAICRVKFNSDYTQIIISDSLYLSQAKPYLNNQEWKDTVYSLNNEGPATEGSNDLPSTPAEDLESLKTLAKSLTGGSDGTMYWRYIYLENGTKYFQFFTGTTTDGATPTTFFQYFRFKGQVSGIGKYKNCTASKPADDLYVNEIYTDGEKIVVYGHLEKYNNGAVYEPNNNLGKFAVWVISTDGVEVSQLFDTLEECKAGPHTFDLYQWNTPTES